MTKMSMPVLALQHVLAMFVANITPMIIVSGALNLQNIPQLLQAVMLVAAINTALQCTVGSRLPVVMGANFTFVPIAIAIGSKYGYDAVLAAALTGGIFEACLGRVIGKFRKFFPPLVTGTVLLSIGLSLIPVGISSLAGGYGAENFGAGYNYILGVPVILVVVLLNQYGSGIWKSGSLFFGVVAGMIVATLMGRIDFSILATSSWISAPSILPYKISWSSFHLDAILGMCVLYIVSAVETMGDMTGIVQGGDNRELTSTELSRGITMDGLGCVVSSIFGTTPTTSFSQNTGIIAMTGVMDRRVVLYSSLMLAIGAFSPRFATLIQLIPPSVLGGGLIILFAMISVSGIKMMASRPIHAREGIILAVSLGIGYGMASQPDALAHAPEGLKLVFGGSGIAVSTFLAVVLNIILPKQEKNNSEKSPTETSL
ncbi:MAG: uracil-xanthine permease family protein [Brevinema sp.]